MMIIYSESFLWILFNGKILLLTFSSSHDSPLPFVISNQLSKERAKFIAKTKRRNRNNNIPVALNE